MASPNSLAVQPEVFREALGAYHLHALAGEHANREAVLFEGAGREALICDVEESDVILGLKNSRNLIPLLLRDVNA